MAERGDPSESDSVPTLRDGCEPRAGGEPTLRLSAPRRASESGEFQSVHALAPGARVGHFMLERKLGEGGMGLVFLARDLELERPVAVKVLRLDRGGVDDANARQRLLREARAMAMLSHPNLVTIYEVGTLANNLFLAMEYVTGQSLYEWLETSRSVEDILSVFDQAGRGLEAMHDAGLVHRDFKPANVVVTEDGPVKVLDLGIARRVAGESNLDRTSPSAELRTAAAASERLVGKVSIDEPLTRDGAIVGTPSYMPLEQILGETTSPASDQFAFAVALFEALTGAKPFPAAGRLELLKRVLSEERHSWPAERPVPPELRTAIDRALSLYPEQRFDSMAAFLDACWAALGRSARGAASTRWQTRPSEPPLPYGPRVPPEPLREPAPESNQPGASKAASARLRFVLGLGLGLVTLALGATGYEFAKQSHELEAARRAELESSVAAVRSDVERVFALAEQDVLFTYDQKSVWLPLVEQLALLRPSDLARAERELIGAAARLNDFFRPIVQRMSNVRWLGVARDDGLAFFVLGRAGSDDKNRRLTNWLLTPSVEGAALEFVWSSDVSASTRAHWSAPASFAGHAPRVAEWFRQARSEPSRVMWTEPYLAAETSEPGTLAAIAWPHGSHRYALAIALALTDIPKITSQRGGARVRMFVTTRGERARPGMLGAIEPSGPLRALAAARAVEPRGHRTLWPFQKGDRTLWAGRAFIDRRYPALAVYAIEERAE